LTLIYQADILPTIHKSRLILTLSNAPPRRKGLDIQAKTLNCLRLKNLGKTMQKYPMTVAGHAALEVELKQLKTVERPYIINAISVARDHGDLSENAEYHAAKEKQGFVEGRIQELESKLSLAQVIDVTKMSGDTVKFGATVTIVNEDTDEESRYQIVGEDEANVKDGKISITSPIARAMVTKGVGDSFEVMAPAGAKGYEILAVEFI
jgi:transcription elongation factor GreA